jgi:hypothetical protein
MCPKIQLLVIIKTISFGVLKGSKAFTLNTSVTEEKPANINLIDGKFCFWFNSLLLFFIRKYYLNSSGPTPFLEVGPEPLFSELGRLSLYLLLNL